MSFYFYLSITFAFFFLIQLFSVEYITNNVLSPIKRQHQKNNLSLELYNTFFNKKNFKLLYWKIQLLPFSCLTIVIFSLAIWEGVSIDWKSKSQIFDWVLSAIMFVVTFISTLYVLITIYQNSNQLKKHCVINKTLYGQLLNNINYFQLNCNNKKAMTNWIKLENQVIKLKNKDLSILSQTNTIKSFQKVLYLLIKYMDNFEQENFSTQEEQHIAQLWLNINKEFSDCINKQ